MNIEYEKATKVNLYINDLMLKESIKSQKCSVLNFVLDINDVPSDFKFDLFIYYIKEYISQKMIPEYIYSSDIETTQINDNSYRVTFGFKITHNIKITQIALS